jgi:hypothetical protein
MRLRDSCRRTILWFAAQKHVLGLRGIKERSLELIVMQKRVKEKLREIAICYQSTAHFHSTGWAFYGQRCLREPAATAKAGRGVL